MWFTNFTVRCCTLTQWMGKTLTRHVFFLCMVTQICFFNFCSHLGWVDFQLASCFDLVFAVCVGVFFWGQLSHKVEQYISLLVCVSTRVSSCLWICLAVWVPLVNRPAGLSFCLHVTRSKFSLFDSTALSELCSCSDQNTPPRSSWNQRLFLHAKLGHLFLITLFCQAVTINSVKGHSCVHDLLFM